MKKILSIMTLVHSNIFCATETRRLMMDLPVAGEAYPLTVMVMNTKSGYKNPKKVREHTLTCTMCTAILKKQNPRYFDLQLPDIWLCPEVSIQNQTSK